ncbi:MAG TPA: hypothetical protein VFN49_11295 [Candidatus Aquilonibacter sp.]|nr:hypothetical protein [Candidatus Aquilonibacter sp.]
MTCALVVFSVFSSPHVFAAIEADPQVLYSQMKAAYQKAAERDWAFRDQETYLSTIFNAGRAYSLQSPNDPNYGQIATLAVQVGAGLHYNPLTNHDAAAWYVREAAQWVIKNSGNPALIAQAQDLQERVNSEDAPATLARLADEDAAANVKDYPGDVTAQLQQVEANWRAWILTGDPSWRTLAFERAANADFPLAHLPTSWGPEFVRAVQMADAGTLPSDAPGDKANAQTILTRLKNMTSPLIIASVKAVPHDVYLSTLAPADEYFGRMGYSVLGIENELKHINFMLDYKYGNREAGQTLLVVDAILKMQEIYPRDRDMPKLLYSALTTLNRMDTPQIAHSRAAVRSLLTIEYQDSPQARKVLNPDSSSS